MLINTSRTTEVAWRYMNVNMQFPAELEKLNELAYNLWWVWNADALELFRNIDRDFATFFECRTDSTTGTRQEIYAKIG